MKVGIVGVGLLPFKVRYPDKTYYELAVDAFLKALEDARIDREEIDNVVYGLGDLYVPAIRQACASMIIQDYLGLEGKPANTVTGGAITGALAVRTAFADILSGISEVSLVISGAKGLDLYDPETGKRSTALMKAIGIDVDTTFTNSVMARPRGFASVVQLHMDRFGSPTEEQMAKVSIKNHRNAMDNPLSQSGQELTIEQVLKSPRVTGPVKFFDACLYSESGAALILANEERARKMTRKPVWIQGVGLSAKRSPGFAPGDEELGRIVCQRIATDKAYQMAGIKDPLNELDVVELNDLCTGIEIISYEEIGLCDLGKGGTLIDEGVTLKSGKLPVNPSGGMLGYGHVCGPTGISRVGHVALQLRGEAGKCQVPITKGRGLYSAVGGDAPSQSCSIVLGV